MASTSTTLSDLEGHSTRSIFLFATLLNRPTTHLGNKARVSYDMFTH